MPTPIADFQNMRVMWESISGRLALTEIRSNACATMIAYATEVLMQSLADVIFGIFIGWGTAWIVSALWAPAWRLIERYRLGANIDAGHCKGCTMAPERRDVGELVRMPRIRREAVRERRMRAEGNG